MTQVLEDILGVKELLNSPERWTKESYGRNANGMPVMGNDPRAVCFCLLGAVDRVVWGTKSTDEYTREENAEKLERRKSIMLVLNSYVKDRTANYKAISGLIDFNDNATYEEVMAMLEEAANNA